MLFSTLSSMLSVTTKYTFSKSFVSFDLLSNMSMSLPSSSWRGSKQLLQTDFPSKILQISIISSLVSFSRSVFGNTQVPFLANNGYLCGFPSALSDSKRSFNDFPTDPLENFSEFWQSSSKGAADGKGEQIHCCSPADVFLMLVIPSLSEVKYYWKNVWSNEDLSVIQFPSW